MAVSLSKARELTGDDPQMISLIKGAKEAAGISLSKHDMLGLTAEVCMVMDFSGSMEGRYRNGEVQAAMERVLALATQFDDDGTVPVFLFHNDAWHAGDVDLTNYRGWIDRVTRNQRMGGTSYKAPVDEVLSHYGLTSGGGDSGKRGLFGKRHQSSAGSARREHPIYVAFFTDGEPQDPGPSEQAVRNASSLPVFWQFIGLGSSFQFLERLDDMGGREVDNADFFSANRLRDMSDEALFAKLLDEFPGWVKTVRSKGWVTAA